MTPKALNRRQFLTATAAAAGGLAAGGCLPAEDPYNLNKPDVPGTGGWVRGEEKTIATACGQCPAGCGINVRVVEGRAVKTSGHAECPVNRGGIGPRGLAGLQVLYDPDRIKQPLVRKGARGSASTLEPIGWDEALELLANRLGKLREDGNPHQLGIVTSRERGLMLELLQRFALAYGTTNFFDGWSSHNGAVATAHYLMQGIREIPAYDWSRTRYVLSLGSNLLGSSCQSIFFARAQAHLRRGQPGQRAKITHIGPQFNRTAMNADEWLTITPNTYGAFALGLAHVLVNSDLHDKAFIDNHCFGFTSWKDADGTEHKGFKEALESYTPEHVGEICNIAPQEVVRIAKELAANRPAFAVTDPTATLAPNGTATAMAVNALNAVLGSIDRPGGVLTQRPAPMADWKDFEFDEIAEAGLDTPSLRPADAIAPLTDASVDLLVEALEAGKPYALDTLMLYMSNPLYARPQPPRWRQALAKVPFIISFSPFMDETVSELADLVLPDHSFLERWEDAAPAPSVGHAVFGVRQPVVEPLHDTRATGDVVIDLAKRLGDGVADAFKWKDFKTALLKRAVGIYKAKRGSIIEKKGGRFLKKLFDFGYWSDEAYSFEAWDEIFQTPSGKFEFFSQTLLEKMKGAGDGVEAAVKGWGYSGLDEVCLPHHVAVNWHGDATDFPLMLLPFKPSTYAEGSGANLPLLQQSVLYNGCPERVTEALMSPETAKAHGMENRETIEVESPFGRMQAVAHIAPGMALDTLCVAHGGGHTAFGRWAQGWGANVMTIVDGSAIDPIGGATPLAGTRVRIRRLSS